jgi:hypothetical protein
MFRRNVLSPISGSKSKPCTKQARRGLQVGCIACPSLLDGLFLVLVFEPEGGSRMFLRNIGKILPDCTALYIFFIAIAARASNPSII